MKLHPTAKEMRDSLKPIPLDIDYIFEQIKLKTGDKYCTCTVDGCISSDDRKYLTELGYTLLKHDIRNEYMIKW